MSDSPAAAGSRSRSAEAWWVLCGTLVCALIWTWPLCTQLGSAVPYDARFTPSAHGSDTHQYLWNLWWTRHALSAGADPFWCPLVFHPRGHSLALHTHAFAYGLLAWPLQAWFGLPAAYNLVLILGLCAAACAAYALGRGCGLGRAASALLAFGWACSPYFQQKAQEHLSYAANPWPPLLCLAILRWRRADSAAAAQLWALCAGAVAGLGLLTDPIGGTWLLVLGALFALIAPDRFALAPASARSAASPARWSHGLLLGAVAFALVAAPYLRALYGELASLSAYHGPDLLGRGQLYHARFSDFLRPSGLQPLFHGLGAAAPLATAAWQGPRPETGSLALGWFVLLAAGAGAWFDRGARRALWIALPLFALCWDPGPDPEGWLSSLYRQLPGFDALRVPSRAFACLHLCVCLAAAIGAQQLLRRAGGRAAVALLALLGSFEWWRVPLDLSRWSVPSAVARIAQDPRRGAVCVLPFKPGSYVSMSWQTIHEKPVTWSYIARVHPSAIEAWRSNAPALFAFAIGEAQPDPAALAAELDLLDIDHLLVPLDELLDPELVTRVLDQLSAWERMPVEKPAGSAAADEAGADEAGADEAGAAVAWWRRRAER